MDSSGSDAGNINENDGKGKTTQRTGASTDWTTGILACMSAKHENDFTFLESLSCVTPRKPRRCRQGCLRSSPLTLQSV